MSLEEVRHRREDHMRKIQALLDRASNTPYEAEAEAARAKADELMTLYTIESWELDRLRPKHEREQVESRFIDICSGDHAAKDGFLQLISALVVHTRCRALHYDFSSKVHPYKVKAWGFPSDLDYLEMLWTSLLLQLAKDMKPEYDTSKSFDENLARFKESGLKWIEMHPLLSPHDPREPNAPFERRIGVRYTGVYTKFCQSTGRKRMYTSPQTFVRSFVEGFANRVDNRLWEQRQRQEEMERSHSGPGTALVLVDRKKEVDDAYNAVAKGKALKVSQKKMDHSAYGSGQRAGDRADLGAKRIGNKRELG